jgi:hypothetical protein
LATLPLLDSEIEAAPIAGVTRDADSYVKVNGWLARQSASHLARKEFINGLKVAIDMLPAAMDIDLKTKGENIKVTFSSYGKLVAQHIVNYVIM